MERSLSVLLPIRNLEATLAGAVLGKLEVFSELTSRAELVLVDDGSEDATGEVADALADAYPQVKSIHNNQQRGLAASIKAGVQASQGEVIFLEDVDCRLPVHEVRRLWELLDRYELVLGRPSGCVAGVESLPTTERSSVTYRKPCRAPSRPLRKLPATEGWVSIDNQVQHSSLACRIGDRNQAYPEADSLNRHVHLHRHTSGSPPRPYQPLVGNDSDGPRPTIRLEDCLADASRAGLSPFSSSKASPGMEAKHESYVLARRWILEALQGTVARCGEILRYLAGRRIPWYEVEIDRRMENLVPRRIDVASQPMKSVHWIDSWESSRADRTLFTSALRKAMGNSLGQ